MALGVLKCRVCGKKYKGCRTSHPNDGVFRWQDVACCPEHGAEYLRQVLEARGELVSEPERKTEEVKATAKKSESTEATDNVVKAEKKVEEKPTQHKKKFNKE